MGGAGAGIEARGVPAPSRASRRVGGDTSLRVAIVDDDEWRRRGRAAGTRELGGIIELAGGFRVEDCAVAAESSPSVVLVEAASGANGWDRFGGLAVAASIRAALGSEPTIVLLTDSDMNPLLPVRAAEAGADYVYRHHEIGDLPSFERLLLAPSLDRVPGRVADLAFIRSLGISFASCPSAGLDLVKERGLTGLFDDPPAGRLSRRQTITLRRQLAAVIGVRPAGRPSAALNQPVLPSWLQLRRLVNLARGHAEYGSTDPS
jgi:hypothetical protein